MINRYILISLASIFWLLCILVLSSKGRNLIVNSFGLNSSKGNYIKGFDGLRGIAALWVSIFHLFIWPIPSTNPLKLDINLLGSKAVPIFIALSGFLIIKSFKRNLELNNNFKEALKHFLHNRFIRVYPLYFFTTLIHLCTFFYYLNTKNLLTFEVIKNNFIGEIFMLKIIGWTGMVNPVSWSLYVEVIFYFLVPFIIIYAGKRLFFYSIIIFVFFSSIDFSISREMALWEYFAIGIIAEELFSKKLINKLISILISVIGLLILFLDIYLQFNKDLNYANATPPEFTFLLSLGIFLLLISIPNSFPIYKFLELLPLKFLGKISYSLYLTHSLFIISIFNLSFDGKGHFFTLNKNQEFYGLWSIIILLIPSMISCSSISYLIFEKPFLRFRSNI